MKLSDLHTWRDDAHRPAARQMALDEAIFRHTLASGEAVARFYGWGRPAVTVGYFHRFGAGETPGPETVRRFTGGGLVEHGADLTFLLTVPPADPPARAASGERYRWVHRCLCDALGEAGHPLTLEEAHTPSGTGACFARPVTWDLLDPRSGAKVGGGAQRRSRGGVIHQGSIRLPEALRDPAAAWIDDFAARLAERSFSASADRRRTWEETAETLESDRYGRESWNRPTTTPS